MSNYYGKIELPQKYSYQGNEHYLSSEKSDAYIWIADENTKQANEIKLLQEQLKEANEIIKGFSKLYEVYPSGNGIVIFNVVKPPSLENYIKKWSVK